MRLVPIKTEAQQATLSLHRARELLIKQRTQVANILCGLLAEFGHIVAKGVHHITALAKRIATGQGPELPPEGKTLFTTLPRQLLDLDPNIAELTKQITASARKDERARRMQEIPGVGPITSSAIIATIGSPDEFRSGRDFAAWLGLTPLNKSSGGKQRPGKISKMGDRYLRRLLIGGMTARARVARSKPEKAGEWVLALLDRKPTRVANVAMANKTARVVWAMLKRNQGYRPLAA